MFSKSVCNCAGKKCQFFLRIEPCLFYNFIYKSLLVFLYFQITFLAKFLSLIKDTNRQNAITNKTQMLTKGMDISIWIIKTLSQLFIRRSSTKIKFSKKLRSS